MNRITKLVAEKPKRIILIALLLLIPTLFGYFFTPVNYDILTYLPDSLNSVEGQEKLSGVYDLSSFTMVIFNKEDGENVLATKDILKLKRKISGVEHVSSVIWSDDFIDLSIPADILPDEIKNIFYSEDGKYTMMFVQFDSDSTSEQNMEAVRDIRRVTSAQCMLSGLTPISADTRELSNFELPIYISLAVVLALAVMFVTMESWLLPLILVGVLGMAVVYNMGTNIILGGISYVTQCIAAILQLGVTMDYSIFLVNRFREEEKYSSSKQEAMTRALHASLTSLRGSSLTTVFGFLALCFMQLTLGFNIGIVMAKGVVIGVLTVITVLPAFLLVFDKGINAHTHKTFKPDFSRFIDFSLGKRKVLAAVFAVLLIPSVLLSANVKKYYNLTSNLPDDFESVQALETMKDKFGMTTSHFIVVNDGLSSEDLLEMETRLQAVDGIKSLIAYNLIAGTSVPDSIVPDEIIRLVKHGEYQLMLATSEYESATDKSNIQINQMKDIISEYTDDGYITGEGAMYSDLIDITSRDFAVTNIISIIAIFALIAFIFKSFSVPAILIASIELAILINEGIATIFGTEIPFVAPTIISCVQLGATVDYAILLTSRFREELSNGSDRLTAVRTAAKESMRSVFQSASIFFAATIGVYIVSSIEIVREICAMLARGSLISALVILFFLTPILYLSEGFIAKTSKGWRTPADVPVSRKKAAETSVQPENEESEEFSYTEFTFSDDD